MGRVVPPAALAIALAVAPILAQMGMSDTIPSNLPVYVIDTVWPSLRDRVSIRLWDRLHTEVMSNKLWASLANKKRFAVGVVDLSRIDQPDAAWINGNLMMYAASLPKIAVLLAAMDAVDKGQLAQSDAVMEDLRAMIRASDNAATTRTIDRIGLAKIAEVVEDQRYGLFDKKYGGGLWVGKRYAQYGPRNPDPLKGLSHAATVSQVCRFYYMLATGQLISPERSRQMLEIMAFPVIHHKFVSGLLDRIPLNRIFRKSGSWKTWHSDSVLLWGEDESAHCIIVALVEHPQGEKILRDLLPVLMNVLGVK